MYAAIRGRMRDGKRIMPEKWREEAKQAGDTLGEVGRDVSAVLKVSSQAMDLYHRVSVGRRGHETEAQAPPWRLAFVNASPDVVFIAFSTSEAVGSMTTLGWWAAEAGEEIRLGIPPVSRREVNLMVFAVDAWDYCEHKPRKAMVAVPADGPLRHGPEFIAKRENGNLVVNWIIPTTPFRTVSAGCWMKPVDDEGKVTFRFNYELAADAQA